MTINEDLIYTGENFNIVFDNADILDSAFKAIQEVIQMSNSPDNADALQIDNDNGKIYIEEGTIGNYNSLVEDICKRLAVEFSNNCFYGHAYYDDDQCGYQSCADYQFENGKLHIEIIESEEGDGYCPECGEQIVCFDEVAPEEYYHCDDCDADFAAEELFERNLPKKKVYDLCLIDGELK